MREAPEHDPSAWSPSAWLEERISASVGRLAEFFARVVPESEVAQTFAAATKLAPGLSQAEGEPASSRPPHGSPTPMNRLAEVMGLSAQEVELLLLAGMPEESEALAASLRLIHPRGESRPTVGLFAQLSCRTRDDRRALRETLERGAAVQSGALRLTGDVPFFERNLELAESLWPALHGIDAWPAALAPSHEPVMTAGLEDWLAAPETERAAALLKRPEACTVLVTADTEEMAADLGAALARHAGVTFAWLRLPVDASPAQERLAALHVALRGVVPVVRIGSSDAQARATSPLFATYARPVVLCAREGAASPSGLRPVVPLVAARLTPTARQRMWAALLPELAEHVPALAARYRVEPRIATEIAVDVRARAALGGRLASLADVADSVRVRCGAALAAGVQVVRPTARWDQLVLPWDRKNQLAEALARLLLQARVLDEWRFLENRPGARGVRMLLAGPPGTGKTLSAEVLATQLGVDLLVVDIARVVSKWIGETEKNLALVFDAAERAQAVLLFDEADALFGKRTEVSDAHDRYANLETAYLLSRIERYEGLVVLSTNLRQNIDPAFMRRLEFVVDLDEPDAAERRALWRCHLPEAAPLAADLDLDEIAALYPMVGGNIRNAAVAAGFLAAAAGASISRRHVVRAIRREYEKAGRSFPGYPAGMDDQQEEL